MDFTQKKVFFLESINKSALDAELKEIRGLKNALEIKKNRRSNHPNAKNFRESAFEAV